MPSPWRRQAMALSAELAEMLKPEYEDEFPPEWDNCDFLLDGRVDKKTHKARRYPMVYTPEGICVHQGIGCIGEPFNGVAGCWHSKDFYRGEGTMTTALTVPESLVPQRIEFTNEQIKTISDVICVNGQGERAPPAFVELFLATCRHSGLNPFLKQIYAMQVKGKWTMYVGVDGYRVISERTGLDAGMDGPEWSDDGEKWYAYPFKNDPKFARVSIWRKGVPRPYVAVCQMSAYRQSTGRWAEDPAGMLAKCAENLARRRAFPANTAMIQSAVMEEPDELPDYDIPAEYAYPDAIEGDYREHGDGAGTLNNEPAVEPASPAAEPLRGAAGSASPPDLAFPGEWWPEVKKHTTQAKATALAKERYGQEPKDLTPAERAELLAAVKEPAAQPALCTHEDGAGLPTTAYDPDGRYVCTQCGEVLPEPE